MGARPRPADLPHSRRRPPFAVPGVASHPLLPPVGALPAPQKHLKALAGYGEDHMLVKKAQALFEEVQAGGSSS